MPAYAGLCTEAADMPAGALVAVPRLSATAGRAGRSSNMVFVSSCVNCGKRGCRVRMRVPGTTQEGRYGEGCVSTSRPAISPLYLSLSAAMLCFRRMAPAACCRTGFRSNRACLQHRPAQVGPACNCVEPVRCCWLLYYKARCKHTHGKTTRPASGHLDIVIVQQFLL